MKTEFIEMINFENEKLSLRERKLQIKNSDIMAIISKNQRKLMLCLMQEINDKNEIIELIWGNKKSKSKESNYNQLVYQTRSLLAKNGFPDDLIITIHRYGLCLNHQFLKPGTLRNEPVITLNESTQPGRADAAEITQNQVFPNHWRNEPS